MWPLLACCELFLNRENSLGENVSVGHFQALDYVSCRSALGTNVLDCPLVAGSVTARARSGQAQLKQHLVFNYIILLLLLGVQGALHTKPQKSFLTDIAV